MAPERHEPHSHRPVSTGGAFYALHSPVALKLINDHLPLFKEIAGKIKFDTSDCFVMCDYGAADGGPEAPAYKAVIDEIRRVHNKVIPVDLIVEDQPTNDWETVFNLHRGFMNNVPSPVADLPEVYLYGSGTGFYDSVVRPGKLHLGMSATCIHFLTKKPCDLPDAVFSVVAAESEQKAIYRNQARVDWEAFLLKRSAELAPSGHFISFQLAHDPVNQYMSGCSENSQKKDGKPDYNCGHYGLMNNTWRQMMQEGVITQEEFKSTSHIDWHRSLEEIKAPFEDENSAVRRSGLNLKQINYTFGRAPQHQTYIEREKAGEAVSSAAYADLYVGGLRTWSTSTFYDGLSNDRSKQEKDEIVSKFYKRIWDIVETNPTHYHKDLFLTVAVFVKN